MRQRTRKYVVLIFLLVVSVFNAVCQNRSLVVFYLVEKKPLIEVLDHFSRNYKLEFNYDVDKLEPYKITTSIKGASLQEALNEIFRQTDLKFEFVNSSLAVITDEVKKEVEYYSICGSVYDALDKRPLPSAHVVIAKTDKGTYTNEQGVFELKVPRKLLSGAIEITYLGYQRRALPLSAFTADCRQIGLDILEMKLENVLVTDYIKRGIQMEDGLLMVINPKRLNNLPGYSEPDIMQMVQLIPGIHSPDESANGLHIRGGTPDHNLILYDDIPVYHSGHLFGMVSGFNSNIVEKVNVFRSTFGPEFGGRVGGVVDIKSHTKVPAKVEGGFGLNFMHGDVQLGLHRC